ncbi:aminotransferase class I/II-fold pyridoxal phosphate-dependent enzyme [Dactylosporangium sp. CA-139114]|uniref:aminotransferase class I/II-fold pyridoxal phosphate-dependent enzyme n=1 Tax=Dactylosporangium sp. CA-139114 TaxID=3239931 RepID=UPI003D95CAED
MSDLALDGGTAARSRPDEPRTPLTGTQLYDDAEMTAVADVIRDRKLWRYHGWRTAEFERRFRDRFSAGDGRALAVNSGTNALYLALAALDLPEGAEIIVPTFGFVAVATAARAAGLVPRFVPVDAGLGLDPDHLDDHRGARAVIAVHPYGAPCDLDRIAAWAAGRGALLVEDVAQCLGGSFRGRGLGTFGVTAAFSFQHFKLLSTGEGGLVQSADPAHADRVEAMHDAAADWTIPATAERVPALRRAPLNLRMSELEAAVGLVQLDRVDGLIARLRAAQRHILEPVAGSAVATARPLADPDGDVGTSVIFHLPTRAAAEWACQALLAEGLRASLLVDGATSNRHWAGTWGPTLRRCGVDDVPASVLASDRSRLGGAVHIPVDVTHDDRDVEESRQAVAKVLAALEAGADAPRAR